MTNEGFTGTFFYASCQLICRLPRVIASLIDFCEHGKSCYFIFRCGPDNYCPMNLFYFSGTDRQEEFSQGFFVFVCRKVGQNLEKDPFHYIRQDCVLSQNPGQECCHYSKRRGKWYTVSFRYC